MVYGIVLTTLMDIDCRRSELSWSREAQQATVENYNNFHRIDIWGFPKMVGNPPKRNGSKKMFFLSSTSTKSPRFMIIPDSPQY